MTELELQQLHARVRELEALVADLRLEVKKLQAQANATS